MKNEEDQKEPIKVEDRWQSTKVAIFIAFGTYFVWWSFQVLELLARSNTNC